MEQRPLKLTDYLILGVAGAFFAFFAWLIIRIMSFGIFLLPIALLFYAL